MEEVWKPVPGWEGYYSASKDGKIKSEARVITRKDGGKGIIVRYKERLMSLCKNSKGYLAFPAMRNGKRTTIDVHRAVFESHVRPLKPGEHVDHINNDKIDNRVSNLQALTEYDHKCLTQRRIKDKLALADFLTVLWVINNKEKY